MQNLPLILQLVSAACLILILVVVSIPSLSIAHQIYQAKKSKTPELDNAIRQINDAIEFDYDYVELVASKIPTHQYRTLLKTLHKNGVQNMDVKQGRGGSEILVISLYDYQGPEFIEVCPLTQEEESVPYGGIPGRREYPKASKLKISFIDPESSSTSLFDTKFHNLFDLNVIKSLRKEQIEQSYTNNVIEIDFTNRKRKS